MIQCQHCGSQLAEGVQFCTNCGTSLSQPAAGNQFYQEQQPQANQFNQQPQGNPYVQGNAGIPNPSNPYMQSNASNPYGQPAQGPTTQHMAGLTQAQFAKHPNMKKITGNIKAAGILFYICGGFTALTMFLTGNLLTLINIFIVVGLGLGVHIAKSRVCAIIVLVYSLYNLIYMLIATGRPGGYLIVAAGITAVIATFKYQKHWKLYQATGVIAPPL